MIQSAIACSTEPWQWFIKPRGKENQGKKDKCCIGRTDHDIEVACPCPKRDLEPCAMTLAHPSTGAACPEKWRVRGNMTMGKKPALAPAILDMALGSQYHVRADASWLTLLFATTHGLQLHESCGRQTGMQPKTTAG